MTEQKKILILAHIYLPWLGGAEVALKEIAERVQGFEFIMITAWRDRKLPRHEHLGKIEVFRVGLGFFQLDQYLYPFIAPLKALRLHFKQRFSMIWAMMPSQAGLAALAFKLFQPQVPYLLTDQSGDSDWFWKIRTFFWWPVFKLIYKKADAVQVISEFLAKRAKKFGYQRGVYIIPNGVDIDLFTQSIPSKTQAELKNKLNIAKERVIISVSRLVHKNGLDTLIKAMKYIDNVKLILIGTGDQENKLRALATENKVIFLGHIKNKAIPRYLSVADVFARPSRSEGQGISFIEAMAAGVPVVATPVGGIVDYNRVAELVHFAEVDNPKDVSEKINELLNDEEKRNTLILNANSFVIAEYDWDKISREMSELFEQLIK